MGLPDLTVLAVCGDDALLDAMGVSASKLLDLNPGYDFLVAAITTRGLALHFAATADDAATLVASCKPADDWWVVSMLHDAVRDVLAARNATLH